MIIVTGATGTIGRDLVKELQTLHAPFKVVARDRDKARKLLGNVEIAVGDLADRASLDAAFKGASKLFLLPAAGPDQVKHEHNAIEAAKQAGIKHVVKLSALGADTQSKLSLGRWHATGEDELKGSGLAFTILRPTSFMQNFLTMAATLKQGSFYGATKEAKITQIDTRDIARVAAHALVDAGHEGKTYTLTGGEAHSNAEAAAIFSRVLGKPVKYVDLPPEQLGQGMRGTGMAGWLVDDLVAMNVMGASGHAGETTDAVEKVGKAKPHTLEQFVRDHAKSFA